MGPIQNLFANWKLSSSDYMSFLLLFQVQICTCILSHIKLLKGDLAVADLQHG